MSSRDEQVLVFDRVVLDDIGTFSGMLPIMDSSRYIQSILAEDVSYFHPRRLAEEDETIKQIIPYVVFCHKGKIFSYLRGKQGDEARLVGNRSIGIGGHINPVDSDDGTLSMWDVYLRAVEREISEEVEIENAYSNVPVAVINDDSNPVGRVHFGIVHLCRLQDDGIKRREDQITDAGLVPFEELSEREDELESWSRLCLEHLPRIANSPLAEFARKK